METLDHALLHQVQEPLVELDACTRIQLCSHYLIRTTHDWRDPAGFRDSVILIALLSSIRRQATIVKVQPRTQPSGVHFLTRASTRKEGCRSSL